MKHDHGMSMDTFLFFLAATPFLFLVATIFAPSIERWIRGRPE